MTAAAMRTTFAASGYDVGGCTDVNHASAVAPMTKMRIGEIVRSIASCARQRHAASPGKRRSGLAANVVRLVFLRTIVLAVDSRTRRNIAPVQVVIGGSPGVVNHPYPW